MFNQIRMVGELLRQMIVDEHPLDLKLARFCSQKLDCGSDTDHHSDLIDKVAILDEAHLFRAAPRFVEGLRREALQALEAAEARATHRQGRRVQ